MSALGQKPPFTLVGTESGFRAERRDILGTALGGGSAPPAHIDELQTLKSSIRQAGLSEADSDGFDVGLPEWQPPDVVSEIVAGVDSH